MEGTSGPAPWTPGQRAGFAVAVGAMYVVAGAAFPRVVYWQTRLGPRGLLIRALCQTLYGFALRQFVMPHFRRMAEKTERGREELRRRLSREPTPDELIEHLGLRPAREP
jgi:hypothetical protein